MTYRSNVDAVKTKIRRATAGGLTAGAQQIVNRVKLGIRGGYKGGRFVTGNTLSSVTITPLDDDGPKAYYPAGVRVTFPKGKKVETPAGAASTTPIALPRWEGGVLVIHIGTNVMSAAFWELGHINLFTGKYERVIVWETALQQGAQDAQDAFARTFTRLMAA